MSKVNSRLFKTVAEKERKKLKKRPGVYYLEKSTGKIIPEKKALKISQDRAYELKINRNIKRSKSQRYKNQVTNEKSLFFGSYKVIIKAKTLDSALAQIGKIVHTEKVRSIQISCRYDKSLLDNGMYGQKSIGDDLPPYFGITKVQPTDYEKNIRLQMEYAEKFKTVVPQEGKSDSFMAKIYFTKK